MTRRRGWQNADSGVSNVECRVDDGDAKTGGTMSSVATTQTVDKVVLPANAYKPLQKGEQYRPPVPAEAHLPEATFRSVAWGLLLCVLFTLASAYSGLKVGQVMEAAIPISILAIGLARVYRRRSTLLENVILTGIGGTSGAVVAGAVHAETPDHESHHQPDSKLLGEQS